MEIILRIASTVWDEAPFVAAILIARLLRPLIHAVAILMLTSKNQTASRIEMLRIMNPEQKKPVSK